jgi:hypothetical protein
MLGICLYALINKRLFKGVVWGRIGKSKSEGFTLLIKCKKELPKK